MSHDTEGVPSQGGDRSGRMKYILRYCSQKQTCKGMGTRTGFFGRAVASRLRYQAGIVGALERRGEIRAEVSEMWTDWNIAGP